MKNSVYSSMSSYFSLMKFTQNIKYLSYQTYSLVNNIKIFNNEIRFIHKYIFILIPFILLFSQKTNNFVF